MPRNSVFLYKVPKAVRIIPFVLMLAVLWVSHGFAQKPKPSSKANRPPVAERITDNVYRVGGATIDTKARTVTIAGEVNMDEGGIEYLAVAPGGKTHESLLKLNVRPLHFQVALLMLELEPKNVLKTQGERTTPQGDLVELRVRWRDKDGNLQTVPAETLVLEKDNRPLSMGVWVFVGSRILKQGFQADLEKSLVAVWHDPAAIIDNPRPDGAINFHLVNSKRCPKRGTKIEFIVAAAKTSGNQN